MSLLRTSSTLLALATISVGAFAQSPRDLGDLLSKYPVVELSEQEKDLLKDLAKRYPIQGQRPESCPLESKNYQEIVSKIERIRGLFKDVDCLDDPTILDQITTEAQTVQTGLVEAATMAGMDSTTVTQLGTQVPVQINGQQISSLLGNINSLLFKNKCNLKQGTVLERGADVIQNFAQLGLLVPNSNGLIVSGGGLALATLMRMVDNLLKKDFNFDTNSDRQNFIKLNCAFYDLRHQIENSGLIDVATESHKADLKTIQSKMDDLTKKLESNTKNVEELKKYIIADRTKFLEENLGLMKEFLTNLLIAKSALNQSLAPNTSRPAAVEQRQMILTMTKLRADLERGITLYRERGLGLVDMFDADFAKLLEKFDPSANAEEFKHIVNMKTDVFDQEIRSNLLFHVERLATDLGDLEIKLTKKWSEETKIEGKTADDYLKLVTKTLSDKSGEVKKGYAILESFKNRLTRVVEGDSGFSISDDGTENKTTILSSFDEITEQVYGKWGYEFLKYTTNRSRESLDQFSKTYKIFEQKHLSDGQVPDPDSRSELEKIFACQDVRPVRMRYSLADSLAQQGHDFIQTNKDLFHAEIPRVFLSSTGGRAGIHAIRSKFEVIQEQYKSSYVAHKILKGERIDPQLKEKYLGKRAERKNYLGAVMLRLEDKKKAAQNLQELTEKFNCHQLKTKAF
ncbi:MAG: hypothetical protein Fur0010_03180 [Bdellovibrio sp.]